MVDRQNLEDISQTHGKLSELFHKLADSNNDADRRRLRDEIADRQQDLVGLGESTLAAGHEETAADAPAPAPVLPQAQAVPGAPSPVVTQPDTSTAAPSPQQKPKLRISKPNWLGEWNTDVGSAIRDFAAACADDEALLLVLYNIPLRDGGGYSSNVGNPNAPKNLGEWLLWVQAVASAISQSREVMVLLEPDALGLLNRLTKTEQEERLTAMKTAAELLERRGATVYVDASTWVDPQEMRRRLAAVGATRFSCNVSGFDDTAAVVTWADKVGLPYVIDTSRNGNGQPHPGKWCNPTDVRIGADPTYDTGIPNCEAFVHAKVAGESDGNGINDDGSQHRDDVPDAGVWWPDCASAIATGEWSDFKKKYGV